MPRSPRRNPKRANWNAITRLRLEELELRTVPASFFWPLGSYLPEHEPNDTLNPDDAYGNLGPLSPLSPYGARGQIGNGAHGAADVDWYHFSLDGPALVNLCAYSKQLGSPLSSVLSLYVRTPFEFGDPQNPFGFRLIAQNDGAATGGEASISRSLAAGTYFVAVSGTGNRYFNVGIAGSGYEGSTGDYALHISSTSINLTSADGPAVLAMSPNSGAALPGSPFAIRVSVSSALDLSTVQPGTTVKLIHNASAHFGNGDVEITLASVNFSAATNELQLFPAAVLAPGIYRLVLEGDNGSGAGTYLAGLDGKALGSTSTDSTGSDFASTFRITGNEGVAGSNLANDTVGTSRNLGDITSAGLVQIAAAIGDDSTDPIPFNPAEVDIYRFRVTGSGRYQLTSEVFAGRIGSPLNPGLTLFKLVDGELVLIGSNDNSRNGAKADDGSSVPLFTDPVLYAGLAAGEYLIVVSSSPNIPDADSLWSPGAGGTFDPNQSHSSQIGFGPGGRYVLNLSVAPDNIAPTVIGTSVTPGSTLLQPPTYITATFSEPVNLLALAVHAFDNFAEDARSVFIQAADGTRYIPRLVSVDAASNQATFMILDGLANGAYELHFSGAEGLSDLAGHRIIGNDPSGDYVVSFTVDGPVRGSESDPLTWMNTEPNETPEVCQELGVLFPREIEAGISIIRTANPDAQDLGDYFRFEILQAQTYGFFLFGNNHAEGTTLALLDADGNLLDFAGAEASFKLNRVLQPGTYYLWGGGWSATEAGSVSYELCISMLGQFEWPPPMTTGPAPAIRIRFATEAPPSTPISRGSDTPQVTLPSINPPSQSGAAPVSSAYPNVYIPATLLASGPLGGVQSETSNGALAARLSTPSEQLVLSPNSTFSDSLLRMAVLTSTGTHAGGTGAESESNEQTPSASGDGGLFQSLLDSWRRTIDAIFGMSGWFDQSTDVGSAAMPSQEAGDAEETTPQDTSELDAAWARDEFAPEENKLMFAALAAVGAVVTMNPPRRRRGRGHRGRRRLADRNN